MRTDPGADASLPPAALVAGGPHVVAIGGGHGLARSLGAARRYAGRITAVVSVADDGGSSGRLRDALSIPAPGDLRKSLVALLPGPSALGDALEHRFSSGELTGHAFGNLLLAALAASTEDFVAAVGEACRLLGTVGDVIPATAIPVTLHAESGGGDVEGQVRIMRTLGVTRVRLDPLGVAAPDAVIAAIGDADQIIVGPGSLYTSVLAALAPRGVTEAIAASSAPSVYVANLREQLPETTGYDVGRHVAALIAHHFVPDVVVADVSHIELGERSAEIAIVTAALADRNGTVHDEDLLACVLADLVREKPS